MASRRKTEVTTESSDTPRIRVFERTSTTSVSGHNGKKKHSKGLKEVSKTAEDLGDAAVDLVDAVSKGVTRFRKESDNSAKKRKDGALVDILPNLGKGLSETLEAGHNVPRQIGEAFDTKSSRRAIRVVSRNISSIFRLFED